MSMSDSEYQRIVEELKTSKAHVPGRIDESWQRIARLNTLGFIDSIRGTVLNKNDYRKTGGAYDATLRRAEALNERCQKLTLWQVTLALHDASHAVAMGLWKRDGSIEACDRGIAEIDVAMCEAERSPK